MTTQEKIAQQIHDKCAELTVLLRDAKHVGLRASIYHSDPPFGKVEAAIFEDRPPPRKFLPTNRTPVAPPAGDAQSPSSAS